MRFSSLGRCLALFLVAGTALTAAGSGGSVMWSLENFSVVGGRPVEVWGAPAWDKAGPGGLRFNGIADGIVVPTIAMEGWENFTVEALISPDADGPEEQRFLHLEDEAGHRALLEIRVQKDGRWCMDSFLFAGETDRLTLIDRTKLHPSGRWHWVALTYADGQMAHFVDGVKECAGTVRFPAMKAGQTSIGVRLNKVYWFKGAIHELRFHPAALPAEKLQRVISLPSSARKN